MTWILDSDGKLTISGTGDMTDWYGYSVWHSFRESVETVVINDGVTSIGNYAFFECNNLTSIEIPEGVTRIGDSAFNCCDLLDSIEIPNSMISIGDEAFKYCGISSIEIPNSVTSIGNGAFFNCNSLDSVKISNSVTTIESDMFSYCLNLRSVEIPNSVTSISSHAFYWCENLASITIPDSIISIDAYAFDICYALKDVYYGSTDEKWNDISISSTGNDVLTYATIHYSDIVSTPVPDSTVTPTVTPTLMPTSTPTLSPTSEPTTSPTLVPTPSSSSTPTLTPIPMLTPSPTPTLSPTPIPTSSPSPIPTATPTFNPPYSIYNITFETEDGVALDKAPEDSGFVTRMNFIEEYERNKEDSIIFAVYSEGGTLLNLNYIKANFDTGKEYSVAFYVPKQKEKIEKIKAFIWDGIGSMEPLRETLEITYAINPEITLAASDLDKYKSDISSGLIYFYPAGKKRGSIKYQLDDEVKYYVNDVDMDTFTYDAFEQYIVNDNTALVTLQKNMTGLISMPLKYDTIRISTNITSDVN